MDESKIVEALKANIARPAPIEAPIIREVLQSAQDELVKPTNIPDELSAYRLMDFFGVETEERQLTEVKDKLGAIFEWASKQINSKDSLDVMSKIRELEQQLGLTFRNDDKLSAIYRWIKLDTQRRAIEQEMALV